jgi:S-adenosylmethionine/arginine decarboxylase-like enzyme
MSSNRYGVELVLDLHGCDVSTFTRESLTRYFVEVCDKIDMTRHGEPMFWHDDSDVPHLKGVSAVQFIETSNIVVHALALLEAVYVNLFSCKEFDPKMAEEFTARYFGAKQARSTVLDRV